MFNPFRPVIDYFRLCNGLLAIIKEQKAVIAEQNAVNDELHRQLGGYEDAQAEAARWRAACDAHEFNYSKLSSEAAAASRLADEREHKLADMARQLNVAKAIADQCRSERDAAVRERDEAITRRGEAEGVLMKLHALTTEYFGVATN